MKKYKNLTITDTNGADCLIVDPRRFGDARGFFESVTIDELNHLGFNKFSQFSDSHFYGWDFIFIKYLDSCISIRIKFSCM